jgi:hypothetical protein
LLCRQSSLSVHARSKHIEVDYHFVRPSLSHWAA